MEGQIGESGTEGLAAIADALRVAVVGNFNPRQSGVKYQAEVLSDLFEADGAAVLRVTYQQNRYLRPFCTVAELLAQAPRFDVVCCQAFSFGNWVNAACAIALGRFLRKRVVVVYRGGGFIEFVSRYRWAVLPFLRRAHRVVVPSGFLREAMDRFGVRAHIIPNIIDLESWPYHRRDRFAPDLLWVRHLREGYNPWMAIEALRTVQHHYPNATLRMAGDGPLETSIRRWLAAESVTGVTLLGHLPMSELQRHYRECSIFISTTNYDNQPRSVLEAMASGLPVVSTNVGGVPFLVQNGVNGLLVQKGRADEMAQAVLRLLGDPAEARRLSEAGLDTVRQHSWAANRERWLDVLSPSMQE